MILTCPFSYASLVYLPPPQVDNWGRRLRNVWEDRRRQWAGLVSMSRFEPAFQQADRAIAAANPLPPDCGTTDIYSDFQIILLSHSARYSPRPVFQSYSAYTPDLERMNAEHLRGPSAPDCILFGMSPLDDHLPPLNDGLSWPELCSRYEPSPVELPFSAFEHLILKRSNRARPHCLIPLGETTAEIGTPIKVPGTEDGPIWAEIDLKPSLAGRLASGMEGAHGLHRGTNSERLGPTFLFGSGKASAGFLLSPLVYNVSAFGWVASTPWSDANWQRGFLG